jgi:hypothetical protein
MRQIAAVLTILAMLAGGCGHPPPPPPHGHGGPSASGNVVANANSVFGPASTTVIANLCAGQKQLEQGTAAIRDSCFSGATNVVLCTDMTSASAVRCTPGPNSLTIAGTGNDLISYARIR